MSKLVDTVADLPPDEIEIYADQSQACWMLKHELKQCIKKSDCMRVQHRSAADCLKTTDGSVSDSCQNLKYTFFQCRKSILDFRTRFRGRTGDA